MRSLVFSIGMMSLFLFSCKGEDKSEIIYYYNGTEEIYIKALRIAKLDNPQYFSNAIKLGIDDKIVGLQILAKRGECVLFINKSRIIIHKSLPLYCFDYDNKSLIEKI